MSKLLLFLMANPKIISEVFQAVLQAVKFVEVSFDPNAESDAMRKEAIKLAYELYDIPDEIFKINKEMDKLIKDNIIPSLINPAVAFLHESGIFKKKRNGNGSENT